jgi:hypothetical protein
MTIDLLNAHGLKQGSRLQELLHSRARQNKTKEQALVSSKSNTAHATIQGLELRLHASASLVRCLSVKRNNVLVHALPAREVARAAHTEERLDTCVLHRVCHKLVHAQ